MSHWVGVGQQESPGKQRQAFVAEDMPSYEAIGTIEVNKFMMFEKSDTMAVVKED
jgi:hypothetical protein